jgi:hypothetical protein
MSSGMVRDRGFLAFRNQPWIECCSLKPPAADGAAASGSVEGSGCPDATWCDGSAAGATRAGGCQHGWGKENESLVLAVLSVTRARAEGIERHRRKTVGGTYAGASATAHKGGTHGVRLVTKPKRPQDLRREILGGGQGCPPA